MNTVKVKREELLTKVRSNRDAHRTLFLKAQEGYRKLVIEELDRMLADAKAGRPIQRSINLAEPADHSADYDLTRRFTLVNVAQRSLEVREMACIEHLDTSIVLPVKGGDVGCAACPLCVLRRVKPQTQMVSVNGGASRD
jgi:hypothetical protein